MIRELSANVTQLSDQLRRELAQSGFTEALTFGLCSHKESFEYLRQQDDSSAVVLANPKTIEFEVWYTNWHVEASYCCLGV